MTLKGWSKETSFPVSTKDDDELKKFKVSTNKWDLVNILNVKMSMQMCNKVLSYICACFLETRQGNYCNVEKSLTQTPQPWHTVFQPEFFLCLSS